MPSRRVRVFRQFRKIEKNEFILVAADGAGGGKDYSATQFLSKTKIDVPLVYHSQQIATAMTNELHTVLERIHDNTGVKPVVAFERNNGGNFEMDRLAAMNRLGKYELFKMPTIGVDHGSKKMGEPTPTLYGWNTTTATRPPMLAQLKNAIDNRVLTIYDEATVDEFYRFVVIATSTAQKAQAQRGAHDDLVMSLAIAWQLYQLCEPPISTMPTQAIHRIVQSLPDEKLFDERGNY